MAVKRKRVNVTGTTRLGLHNAEQADKALIAHLVPNVHEQTLLIHNQQLYGTRKLHSYGVYACDACGHLNPIERHDCRQCHEPKFINLKN
jgi:hypothetical protein